MLAKAHLLLSNVCEASRALANLSPTVLDKMPLKLLEVRVLTWWLDS